MKTKTELSPPTKSKKSVALDVLAAPSSPAPSIETRSRLPATRLLDGHAILELDRRIEPTKHETGLVTRRYAARRRKRILKALALILCVFPPMWPILLVAWFAWRSKPPQQSMRLVRKGVKALEKSHTGVALKHFQEAHFLDPSNNDALYWLGLLLSKQHRYEEAAEALSLVSERVPSLPEVEAALVEAYVAMNAPEGAIYHAQHLLDFAPYAPETLLKLAEAYEAAGQFDLAIKALEQAPLHKRILTEGLLHIHYRLGLLYERQGNLDQALHHFKLVYARDITFKDIRTRVQKLEADQV